jgi:hypothetical protein
MDFSAKENLVNIDVAEAGYEVLVEQGALYLAGSARKTSVKEGSGERAGERFRPKSVRERGMCFAIDERDPAKLALIPIPQIPVSVEMDREVFEANRRGFACGYK